MSAFATADDLAKRMRREFSADEAEWIDTLLGDATGFLRGVVGYEIAPRRQATFTAWPDTSGEIQIPQAPIVSIDAVTVSSAGALTSVLDRHYPGDVVELFWIDRAGQQHTAKTALTS